MNMKLAMALRTARAIPTTLAQVRPASSPTPARATTIPRIRWIHPQVVMSNWNRYWRVAR
jgi:hypothetical protein